MATARDGLPYIYVTWITGLLSTDDQCRWSAWFKAHYRYEKHERDNANLAKWKADHGAMVEDVASELRAGGWTVYLEGQNKFTLKGEVAKIAGTPDVVAVKGDEARVVDCKSGKRRDKDLWQVFVYMLALPVTHWAVKGKRLSGEVRYPNVAVEIRADEFTDTIKGKVVAQIRETGGAETPRRVPSYRECQFCDIGECSDRVMTEPAEVTTALF